MQKIDVGFGDMGEIIRIARRRKGLVIAVAALLFGACFIYVSLIPRLYSSNTLILLSSRPAGELGASGSEQLSATDPFAVRSEVEILISDDIARRVIKELDLAHNPEFNDQSSPLSAGEVLPASLPGETSSDAGLWSEEELREDQLLSAYKKRLSVFNDGRSLTVSVGFSAEDPRLARAVADAHARMYLAAQAERRIQTQHVATSWLNQELQTRAEELRQAETAVQAFRAENGFLLTQNQENQESTVDQELNQLNEELTTARTEVAKSQARFQQISEQLEIGTLQGTSDVMDSPILVKLRELEADAQTQLTRLVGWSSDASSGSSTKAAQAELQSVQATIKQELQRIRDGLHADVRAAEARVGLLEAELAKTQAKKLDLNRAEIKLRELESLGAAKRSIYEAVLNRYNVLLSEQKFEAADAQIVSAATVPTRPSYPKRKLFLGLGLCLSLGAGVGSALAMEWLRRGVGNLSALAKLVQLRPLASVPLPEEASPHALSQLTGAIAGIPRRVLGKRLGGLATPVDRDVLFSERMRELRTVLLADKGKDGLVVLVTSSLPNEGTSLIAVHLAKTVSALGHRTLLMEGDLRRPSLAGMLDREHRSDTGLGDVLTRSAQLDEAILGLEDEDFALMPAGSVDSAAIDALGTDRMASVIAVLRRHFSVIVIDSPPLAAVSDALALARLADQTIMVVRANSTPTDQIQATAALLKERGVAVAGVVLTGESDDDAELLSTDLQSYYAGRTPDMRSDDHQATAADEIRSAA